MDLFNVLELIGGLCLFLFGMDLMGQSLERRAGSALRSILGKLTNKKSAGFLTGLGVTAVIQSSSATTVMVVGFVNSGLMALKQAINVIMGANVGTTVTAWILSLSGIESDNFYIQLLKPTSFTPLLALLGIVFTMFLKKDKSRDTGTILLGFATLMFGMDTMSAAVSGLKEVEAFRQLFVMFQNPILGVLAGAVLTAVIQSSSASVGILQSLAAETGAVTYGSAVPIIMGQNIGTCVTALLSSVGATRNARRAAMVHLLFNIIGTVVWLAVFSIIRAVLSPAILGENATMGGIAVCHTIFNVLCTVLLLPMSNLLEKMAMKLVPEPKAPEKIALLDDRLLATPFVALERSHAVATEMAVCAIDTMRQSLNVLANYTPALAEDVRKGEESTDQYEDMLGSYLVKLSALQLGKSESTEAAMLLKAIGDFERISDHAINVVETAEEQQTKNIGFTEAAQQELNVLLEAVREILDLLQKAFVQGDDEALYAISPLEHVIDDIKERLRNNHIARLQQGDCTIEVGFIWSDLLTDLERVSDHCSNVAGCLMDVKNNDLNSHAHLRSFKQADEHFREAVKRYSEKYSLA